MTPDSHDAEDRPAQAPASIAAPDAEAAPPSDQPDEDLAAGAPDEPASETSMLGRAMDLSPSGARPLPRDPSLEQVIERAGAVGTTLDDAAPSVLETPEASSADGAGTAPRSLDDLLGSSHPGSKRALPRILAVANQKGGVGKTTTTINLAACLAEIGYRVLVVDLDPQANATTGLGIDPRSIQASMYDVILQGVPMAECALPTELPLLRIAPSSLDLAGAEIELVPTFNRERKVALALEPMLPELDFVFIDCPPSLGLLTVNALTAASEVLVPIQCEYYALEGLGQLLRNVELVQRNLNQELEVSTIALVMYDGRTKLSAQVVAEVRAHFGDKVCRQIVPRSVRLSEAPSFGQPIILFDERSRGALAYRELAKEVSGGPPDRTR